jgi:glycosyltransferase involved in cell wall biosynthesis
MGTSTLHSRQSEVLRKVEQGDRLRILFINDLGFQYGAGIAMLRQVQSFLVLGHEVAVFSWYQGQVESTIPVSPHYATGKWLGIKLFNFLDENLTDNLFFEQIYSEVKGIDPDIIIFGNLHSAQIPLTLLPNLREAGYPVIAYMHDCYFATGRCAYPGECELFKVGCNETCPTWDEYPVLEPQLINSAWQLKQKLFSGNGMSIPIATNSSWTLGIAKASFKKDHLLENIYYGLDHELFKPWSQKVARKLLGLPEDAFIVLSGAVNMKDSRKGGRYVQEVINLLKDKAFFLLFGAESEGLRGVSFTGLNRDYRKMPLLYSAANVFLGTSLEEAFGQTFCEASACKLPVVAFNVGGISEIAQPGFNALLADNFSANKLVDQILKIKSDQDLAKKLGENGRHLVETQFTLAKQGNRWMDFIEKVLT